jgi:redox-sensitive bicupin YhaK (pirin superfamily)
MITIRKSEERRHIRSDVQNTWMTFDPEDGKDPLCRGFHALESLNEELVAPEMGLHPHAAKDMDVITYVREGALIHQEEAGGFARMEAGEFQRRSVSIERPFHALNGSFTETAHVFQSGLTPDRIASGTNQEKKRFYAAERKGTLRLVASQGGRRDSLALDQDIRMYSAVLLPGCHLVHEFEGARTGWLHVVDGRILLQDQSLRTGDGAALIGEVAASFTAQEPSEILLFDLA